MRKTEKDILDALNDDLADIQAEVHDAEKNAQDAADELSNAQTCEVIADLLSCLEDAQSDLTAAADEVRHRIKEARALERKFLALAKAGSEDDEATTDTDGDDDD